MGAFLTAAYTFRMVFVVFFGPERETAGRQTVSRWMVVPFAVLAFLGAVAGLPELLNATFGVESFYHFLHSAMPGPVQRTSASPAALWVFQAIYAAASLAGIGTGRRSLSAFSRLCALADSECRRLVAAQASRWQGGDLTGSTEG